MPASNKKIRTGVDVEGSSNFASSIIVNGKSSFNDAIKFKTRLISSTGNISNTDYILRVDCSLSAITLTLPNPSTCTEQIFIIKDSFGNSSSNAITILQFNTDTIDGNNSVTLNNNYAAITLLSNGTNWEIL